MDKRIKSDSEIAEHRRNRLKEDDNGEDVKAPLRDRIVKRLFNDLEEMNIAQKVTEAWYLESANIVEQMERQQIYLQSYDTFVPSESDQAGSPTSSSNLHLPMPFIVGRAYSSRFMEALWGIDPPFTVKARREDGTDKAPLIEDLMRYALVSWSNKFKGAEATVEEWIEDWCKTGTGYLKFRWERDYRRYVDVELVDVPAAPLIQIDPESGKEIVIPQVEQEEQEVERTIKYFEGPMLEVLNFEDVIVVGGKGDTDDADKVMHRMYMTASELWQMVDQGLFDREGVEKLIKGGPSHKFGDLNNSLKNQRALNAGKSNIENDARIDRYEVLETYTKMPVDDSGLNSNIVVWTGVSTPVLLRATYLHRVSPGGFCPIVGAHFVRRKDSEQGIGLMELIHPLTVELDFVHNVKNDFALMQNSPVGFIRANSSMDAAEIQMEPGALIPVDNPQTDIVFPQRPNSTGFYGNEEALINQYLERLTGLSDLNFGANSGVQGATRTATGTRALLQESNTNLSTSLRRLNRAWSKILRLYYHKMKERITSPFAFRVTGSDGLSKDVVITPEDLGYDFDFELSANSAQSNKSVSIEIAQQLVNTTMNPLLLQTGVVTPDNVYAAQLNYLKQIGVKDPHRYITKPAGYEYGLDPQEIFTRACRGDFVQPGPKTDNAAVIAFIQTMLDQQTDTQTLSEEQIARCVQQMRMNQSMQQALDQQQAQASAAQQMQANQAQSQNQASPGLNPLAGADMGLPGGSQ